MTEASSDAGEVSQETIENAKKIGIEIMQIMEKMSDNKSPLMQASASNGSVASFQDYMSDDLKNQLKAYDIAKLEAEGAEICTLPSSEKGLMTSKFGCALCTTGLTIGIAAAIGGAIVLSGGMSIPAVLAASGYSMTGLGTVISAMTGVSHGAIMLLLKAAGTTLGLLVLGLCEAMGKC